MLQLVRSGDQGLTAGEVAARTGLHLSTARDHLERLTSAGLLARHRDRQAGRPGRPAWRYRAAAPDPAPAPYRDLAEALLEQVGATPAAAERAGRRWGRRLAGQMPAGRPVEVLRRVLDQLGFATGPATGAGVAELHLRACPFLELVARQPEAMCGLHRGVIRGVLGGRDGARAATLVPFGAPDACVVRLPEATGPEAAGGGRADGPVPS